MRFGAGSVFATIAAFALASAEVRAQSFTKMPFSSPVEVPLPRPQDAAPREATVPAPEPGQVPPQVPAPVALQGEASLPGPASTECGAQAGVYLAPKNLKIWVTRRGSMIQDNPLRPLTHDEFVILQIVVNNRLASAYGPDFDNMRRAGPPQSLEGAGTKITWAPEAGALPRSLRVVAEDGAVVLGPIPFSDCAEAPKVAAPSPTPKRPRKVANPNAEPVPRSTMPLPQGAIP